MEMIQQLEQQIALLKIQLLLKEEQIKSKEEQLQRKKRTDTLSRAPTFWQTLREKTS